MDKASGKSNIDNRRDQSLYKVTDSIDSKKEEKTSTQGIRNIDDSKKTASEKKLLNYTISNKSATIQIDNDLKQTIISLKKLATKISTSADTDINSTYFYTQLIKKLNTCPVSIAYEFLKIDQKLPKYYAEYVLLPFLATTYVNADITNLNPSITCVKTIAKQNNITNYNAITFEDILTLKNALKLQYQQTIEASETQQLTNELPSTSSDKSDNILPPALLPPKEATCELDDIDKDHIKYLVHNNIVTKATKYNLLNRIKRYFLGNKIKYILSEVSFIIGIAASTMIFSGLTLGIHLVVTIFIRILFKVILALIHKFHINKGEYFIQQNLDKGLALLNKTERLSDDEFKLIGEIRKKYGFLYEQKYLPEIYNSYAELEKMHNKLDKLQLNNQSLQDKIDAIELEERIQTKTLDLNNYLNKTNEIFFILNKELQSSYDAWFDIFHPKLESAFANMTQEEKEKVFAAVLKKKNIKIQLDHISLMSNFDKKYFEQNDRNIAKTTVRFSIDVFLGAIFDKLQGVTTATLRGSIVAAICRFNFIEVLTKIANSALSSLMYFQSYIQEIILFVSTFIGNKINNYINKKKLDKINAGEKEQTGFLFGLVNTRPRTNREEISTVTKVSQPRTASLFNMMQKHKSKMHKYIADLKKNDNIPAEKLLEMLIDFQYTHAKINEDNIKNHADISNNLSARLAIFNHSLINDKAQDEE